MNRHLDLIYVLARTQLMSRYKQAVLGYLWSVAHPLAFASVFYYVFQIILPSPRSDMAAFLITGLFPWQWVSNTVTEGTMVFVNNGGLIRKVCFPRYYLPLSMVLQDGWHFLLALPVMLLILFLTGITPNVCLLIGLPLMVILQGTILFGIALLLGSLNMFLRDIQHLVSITIMLGFYATPIIYEAKQVPAAYQWIPLLNPFTSIIDGWRRLLLHGEMPWEQMGFGLMMAAIFLTLGGVIYRLSSRRFAELL